MALLTGDIDFRPLVDALVDLGRFVVLHAAGRASGDLIDATDDWKEMDATFFVNVSAPTLVVRDKRIFTAEHEMVAAHVPHVGECRGDRLFWGKMRGSYVASDRELLTEPMMAAVGPAGYACKDEEVLRLALKHLYGAEV